MSNSTLLNLGPSLPPGWTEHKAPTGHSYYYHAASKTSTYVRPQPVTPCPAYSQQPVLPVANATPIQYASPRRNPGQYRGRGDRLGRGGRLNTPRKGTGDRPKSKRSIPGAEPWALVTTKKGRTFVHNLESKISLWAAPKDVQIAIDMMPAEEKNEALSNKATRKRSFSPAKRSENASVAPRSQRAVSASEHGTPSRVDEVTYQDGAGYVTDESGDGDEESGPNTKRAKLEGLVQTEFTEEDVAWQLEAMADEYGLDEDLEEGEELAEEDGIKIFQEMLDEYRINPYGTWDGEMPRFVEDDRYAVLPSTKLRKEVFTTWCRDRIASLKAEKEKIKKSDPRIPFWAFLKENATIKLYWPEFKRKWKKASEMKDSKLVDKDREKMYRDYISHIKSSDTIRENDLIKLLKSTRTLSRQTSLDSLPESVLVDVRYITAPEDRRDRIIETYLERLPDAPMNEEEQKVKEEAKRKTQALQERERQVARGKAMLRGEEARARDLLRGEEAAIERAKRVGKRGLLGHLKRESQQEYSEDAHQD